MTYLIDSLNNIDWDFSDYKSDLYPADLGTVHWYPAAFVPQIPYILINELSQPNDIVLDPFSGSGVTILEASRLNRRFIGIDSNPYAIKISLAKLKLISCKKYDWILAEIARTKALKVDDYIDEYLVENSISENAHKWFEKNTLAELCKVHQSIKDSETEYRVIKEVAFSSILNKCCSQKEHYTYITDNCYPSTMTYKPARNLYIEQLVNIYDAALLSKRHYKRVNNIEWDPVNSGSVFLGDSRSLKFIKDGSVHVVVTSPPYLGVNDYVRSLKLTDMFFKEKGYKNAIDREIGARRKRARKSAFEEYTNDMIECFTEIDRILCNNAFLSIVLGQGRGKVNKQSVVDNLVMYLQDTLKYKLIFKESRRIKFRRIQVPGVGKELILVLRKGEG